MYEYQASVLEIIDGDTLDLQIDVGFYIAVRLRVRLMGVDTPEMRGASAPAGQAAKQFVAAQLPLGSQVLVRTHKIEKFGRYLADLRYVPSQPAADPEVIRAQGVDLAETLLEAGHAETYRGLLPTDAAGDGWDDLAD